MGMKKRIKAGLTISYITAAILLTGCADEIPEMSEQQTELITEYAAGSVLDQMPESASRLVDTSKEYDPSRMTKYEKNRLGIKDDETFLPADEGAPEDDEALAADENTPEDVMQNPEPAGNEAAPEQEDDGYAADFADVMGLSGIDISLDGFSVVDKYPESTEGTDTFLSIDASAGTKLMVAHLTVTNLSGQEAQIDTISRSDLHYKMIMDGAGRQNTLVTLLDDDFSTMNKTLEAGQSLQAVLVSQISEELAASVTGMEIEVKSDSGTARLSADSGMEAATE